MNVRAYDSTICSVIIREYLENTNKQPCDDAALVVIHTEKLGSAWVEEIRGNRNVTVVFEQPNKESGV